MKYPEILTYLKEGQFEFELLEHPPVRTVEEANIYLKDLPAQGSKNLFLEEEKTGVHWLVSVCDQKRVDLKALTAVLNSRRFSFGKPEAMMRYLGVEPGAVTLLGLINDTENSLRVAIDRDLWLAQRIQCHPLVNTASILISPNAVERFIVQTGHKIEMITVPEKS